MLEKMGSDNFGSFVVSRSTSNVFLIFACIGFFSIGQKLLVRHAIKEWVQLLFVVIVFITFLSLILSFHTGTVFSMLLTYSIFVNNLALLLVKSFSPLVMVALSRMGHLIFLIFLLNLLDWEKYVIKVYSWALLGNAIMWLIFLLFVERKKLILALKSTTAYDNSVLKEASQWWLSNILNSSYRQGELLLLSLVMVSDLISQWRFIQIMIDGSRMLSGLFIEAEFRQRKTIKNLVGFLRSTILSVFVITLLSIVSFILLLPFMNYFNFFPKILFSYQLLMIGVAVLISVMWINWARHTLNFINESRSVLIINLIGFVILVPTLLVFESMLIYSAGWLVFMLFSLIVLRNCLRKVEKSYDY